MKVDFSNNIEEFENLRKTEYIRAQWYECQDKDCMDVIFAIDKEVEDQLNVCCPVCKSSNIKKHDRCIRVLEDIEDEYEEL
jgi:hypothetical protein